MTQPFIHALADVQSTAIGAGTRIWQFVVVLPGAKIGADCNICSHSLIENGVVIGDRVTVKSGVQLWDGLRVADDVFIGPNVTFTNDKYPKSRNANFKESYAQLLKALSNKAVGFIASFGPLKSLIGTMALKNNSLVTAPLLSVPFAPKNRCQKF